MNSSKPPHYNEARFHRVKFLHFNGGIKSFFPKFLFILLSALTIGLLYSSPVLAQDIKITVDDLSLAVPPHRQQVRTVALKTTMCVL